MGGNWVAFKTILLPGGHLEWKGEGARAALLVNLTMTSRERSADGSIPIAFSPVPVRFQLLTLYLSPRHNLPQSYIEDQAQAQSPRRPWTSFRAFLTVARA